MISSFQGFVWHWEDVNVKIRRESVCVCVRVCVFEEVIEKERGSLSCRVAARRRRERIIKRRQVIGGWHVRKSGLYSMPQQGRVKLGWSDLSDQHVCSEKTMQHFLQSYWKKGSFTGALPSPSAMLLTGMTTVPRRTIILDRQADIKWAGSCPCQDGERKASQKSTELPRERKNERWARYIRCSPPCFVKTGSFSVYISLERCFFQKRGKERRETG